MLVEFSISNFRSIKELQSINFIASPLKKGKDVLLEENLIATKEDFKLLKSLGLYGANGSGKSNIVKGLMNFFIIVRDVMSQEATVLESKIEPFYFDDTSKDKPTFFQIQFILEDKMYRYGFEANQKEIISEWLFGPAKQNDTFYFTRNKEEGLKINTTYFKEAAGLEKNLSNTNLFLNVVNALNGSIAKKIKFYFQSSFAISMGVSDIGFRKFSLEMLSNEHSKKQVINFLNTADVGIENIFELESSLEEHEIRNESNNETSKFKPLIGTRSNFDSSDKVIGSTDYLFDVIESEGTKKLFNYAGALLNALQFGKIFVVDEFDARLHTNLTKRIIKMFNSEKINKLGAQILFVTHDTNLLKNDLLRRDQIYFAEKDLKGRTSYFSLYDFKGVRNDASFEKEYVTGTYGAIPFLGDFNELFESDETN